ncbi:MAG: DUF1573 domain-containing protein [Gemmataceae bacterium]|nr:DUF1573 domain-containing protein [Gemmataceae bacterium]
MDLGIIKEPTRHTFRFENRSSEPVRIIHIRSSCNCTTTEPEKKLLNPGESGRLTVSVNPRNEKVGKHVYVVDLEYQGTRPGQRRLSLRVQHRPDVTVPESLTIRSVAGRTTVADFALVDYRDRPLDIEGITTSSPDLRARVAERPTQYLPGWRYRIEIAFTSNNLPPSTRQETVLLRTTDPDHRTISVC